MNTRRKLLAMSLAGLLGLGGTSTVIAYDGEYGSKRGKMCDHGGKWGKHGKRGGKFMHKRMAKKLDLTDAQQEQMKSIREAGKATIQPLREQMHEIREAMSKLDINSANYSSEVAVLADKKANIARQMFIEKANQRQQFQAILTEEQRAKLEEIKEKKQQRYKRRHGDDA